MVDFTIPEEIRMILEGLRHFLRQEVEPLEQKHQELLENKHRSYQPDGRLAPEVVELFRRVRIAASRAGYYTLFVPQEVGGAGKGPLTLFLVWEALYHHAGPARELPYQSIAHWVTIPGAILKEASPQVREEVLPHLLSGEHFSCFALSEPDAGSDIWRMKTRAVRQGDVWVANGSKQWISYAPYAEHALIFAVTDPELASQRRGGLSCFLVDTHWPGFSVDGVIRLFGHVGGMEGILSFTDLRIPASRLIGEEGGGFRLALSGVNTGRLYNGARAVGLGRWALERACAYAQQRVAFGQPIGEYQGIQWLLADSAVDLYAARTMGLHCAWKLEQGERAVKEVAMLKAFATEAGFRVIDRCMQVFGGMGLTNDMKLYDALHQLRIVRIADGSAEIMRRTIASRLLRGDLSL